MKAYYEKKTRTQVENLCAIYHPGLRETLISHFGKVESASVSLNFFITQKHFEALRNVSTSIIPAHRVLAEEFGRKFLYHLFISYLSLIYQSMLI